MSAENEIEETEQNRDRSRSPLRQSRSRSNSPIRRRRPINIISTRVHVKNIPYEVKWQELKDIFRENVGGVKYAELEVDSTGRSKGTGDVVFQDMDSARKAVEKMHRFKLKERKLIVLEERESERDARGGDGGHSEADMYQQVMKQLNLEGPITNTVFISNLDYTVDNRKLREVFCMAGKIARSEVMTDNMGKSRGNALVQFESAVDAIQAISLFNGQELYSRTMRVKMDKESSMGGNNLAASQSPRLPAGLKGIGQSLQSLGIPASMPSSGGGLMGNMGNMGNMGGGNIDLNTLASLTGLTGGANVGGGNFGSGFSGNHPSIPQFNNALGGFGGASLGLSQSLLGGMGGLGGFADNQAAINNLLSMANVDGFGMGRMNDFRGRGDDRGGERRSGLTARGEESTVLIKNMPYNLSWQDLKERFKDAGFDVRYVEIKTENNKSQGMGTVRFSSPEEAEKAVDKMHRTKINGRELVLKMALPSR